MPSSLEPLHLSLLLDFPGHRSYQPTHRQDRSTGELILPRSSLNPGQLGVSEWINISASSPLAGPVVKSRFYPVSQRGPARIEFQVPIVVTCSFAQTFLWVSSVPASFPHSLTMFPWIICQTSYTCPGLQLRVGFWWKSKQDIQSAIDPARVWNRGQVSRKGSCQEPGLCMWMGNRELG